MTRMRIFTIVLASFAIGIAWNQLSSLAIAEPLSSTESAPAPIAKQSQMPELKEAAERFQNRDYEGAVKALRAAAKKDPSLPPPHLIMFQWFAGTNSPSGACSALERAAYEMPDDPEAFVIMGDLAVREHRLTEAEMLYEKCRASSQHGRGTPRGVRNCFRGFRAGWPSWPSPTAIGPKRRNNWKPGWRWIPRAFRLCNNSPSACSTKRMFNGALTKLKAAKEFDASQLTPEAILAQFYIQDGDMENAGKWVCAALAVAPKDLKTQLAAAQWAFTNGKVDEAKNHAIVAMQLDPASLEAKIARGTIALFQKDYKAAELYFESAHNQAPTVLMPATTSPWPWQSRRKTQKNNARSPTRKTTSSNIPRNDTHLPKPLRSYGWVMYKVGRHEDAEKCLRTAASSGSAISTETAYHLARVLVTAATKRKPGNCWKARCSPKRRSPRGTKPRRC